MIIIRKQLQKIVQNLNFFRLNSKVSNTCKCYRENEGLHAISKVEEESS